jgi:chloramphenicol 3-O-phosphotransferase
VRTFFHWVLLALFWASPASAEGIIVLLNGTGSAGKSSIGRELDRTLENSVFLSEELLVFDVYCHLLEQHHLQSPKPLKDIGELMDYRRTLPAEQEAALRREFRQIGDDLIKDDMHRLIQLYLSRDKDIVIDNSMWTAQQIEEWHEAIRGCPTLNVVVYCSLQVLLEHIQTRNLSPLTYEHRDVVLPLEMYFSIYHRVEEAEIDCLERGTVERDLARALAYKRQRDPNWENDDSSLIQDYLARLGLDENKTVKIAPFFAYDLCVNTGTQSTPECAAVIKQALKLRHADASRAQ